MSISVPALLPDAHYLRTIKVQTGGIRALTHLALVRGPTGVAQRAYVKQFPADAPRSLFNEWFGYIFMSALTVPQPQAAVLRAPIPGGTRMAWSFVSFEPLPRSEGTPKEIYNPTDAAQLKKLAERLLACHAFATLTAADQLCINGDRNMGNLVFTGPRSFVAIDHSDILGGCGWQDDSLLRPSAWAQAKLMDLCESIKPLTITQCNALAAAADIATEALHEQWLPLRAAMADSREACLALDAVWWRSLDVARWYRERLKLLA